MFPLSGPNSYHSQYRCIPRVNLICSCARHARMCEWLWILLCVIMLALVRKSNLSVACFIIHKCISIKIIAPSLFCFKMELLMGWNSDEEISTLIMTWIFHLTLLDWITNSVFENVCLSLLLYGRDHFFSPITNA